MSLASRMLEGLYMLKTNIFSNSKQRYLGIMNLIGTSYK